MNNVIDYALVEEKRPPIYTAMKYWGKKPHNIWFDYIMNYTPQDGKFLDPFCGSAMSAFESIRAGRIAYAFDINPLSSFIIEVLTTEFDADLLTRHVNKISEMFSDDKIYMANFITKCKKCGNSATIKNYKWADGHVYEIAIECKHCRSRYTEDVDGQVSNDDSFEINYWVPTKTFYNEESFSKAFVKSIGGNKFSDLWTKRNLYVLSKIFDYICKLENSDVKTQLLFGFIQCLHLSSKMCVPRRKSAQRDFSTSWGRSAYLCASRQMEMNVLPLFINSCVGKQSVSSALKSVSSYLNNKPIIYDVNSNKQPNKDTNLFYGIVDVKEITKIIKNKSIDFILTDPPYGGLVQYLDLSTIWLVWLEQIDSKYNPKYDEEITIKAGLSDLNKFNADFTKALSNLREVLKDDGKLVLTFNNKDLLVWNSFLKSISNAGFKIEKVIHQQNKRTGESNVVSKFGISSSDFYITCIKSNFTKQKKLSQTKFEDIVIQFVSNIISERNESTNYDILFAGVLTELSKANIDIENCNANIEAILRKNIDKIFIIDDTDGSIKWTLKKLDNTKPTLTNAVDSTIQKLILIDKIKNKDEILAKLFKSFPNGLTPDPVAVDRLINKYLEEKMNGR